MIDAYPSTQLICSAPRRPGRASPAAAADATGVKQEISRNRTENLLHGELRRLRITPVEEFARLQVARRLQSETPAE
jgi:hypothetical protein